MKTSHKTFIILQVFLSLSALFFALWFTTKNFEIVFFTDILFQAGKVMMVGWWFPALPFLFTKTWRMVLVTASVVLPAGCFFLIFSISCFLFMKSNLSAFDIVVWGIVASILALLWNTGKKPLINWQKNEIRDFLDNPWQDHTAS